jgi:hypothetical protein
MTIIRGEITFDPDAVGKPLDALVLVGRLSLEDGGPIFELLMDYHVCYRKRESDGYESLWIVSRPVADRAKYPNWPKPEPTT